MKLLAIVCRPKPIPTPSAPAKTVNVVRSRPMMRRASRKPRVTMVYWLKTERLLRMPRFGGRADAEHRIQQQLHRAGAGADDQVRARDGRAKALAHVAADALHAQQHEGREGDGKHRQRQHEAAVPDTLLHQCRFSRVTD